MSFSFGGATTSTSSNLFGSGGFGSTNKPATASSSNMFGGAAVTGGFGAKTSTASSGGLFGASAFGAKTTTASTGGLFGATATGGFGAKATTASSGGLFGASSFATKTTTASSGGLFGGATTGFGSKPTTGTTGGLFGSKPAAATTGGLFGSSSFGAKAPTASAGMFGGGFNLNKTATQQAAAVNQQQNGDTKALELLATARALSSPVLFSNAKDEVIIKWNQLQAFWGKGRGFYTKEGACINFSPESYFCRFKAVGYSLMPSASDEDGLVGIVCNKKKPEMEAAGLANISSAIHKIMGSNGNINVQIESISELPNDKCQVCIYVTEKSGVTGATRRIFASELFNFMEQANVKQQLQQQLAMDECLAKVAMSPEQVDKLLSQPPAGIDPVVWEQAKLDNPDPSALITVPMLGFDGLRSRLDHQQLMARQQQKRVDIMSEGLEKAKHDLTNTQSKIDLFRRKSQELGHRLLEVAIMQEIVRKNGQAIQPEEELLRVKLERFINELNAPMKYRGRLNELLSQTRMHHRAPVSNAAALDNDTLVEISKHLKNQQEGLNTLVTILKNDFEDLNKMKRHLQTEPINHHPYGR